MPRVSKDGYTLIQDDDGHWYVCPRRRRWEAEAYFVACADDSLEDMPEQPEWLEGVDGPHVVVFDAYRVI